MVSRLLIERPTLFAAGVANISSLPATDVPRPKQGTPIMMVNGTEDPLIPWQGGAVKRVAREPIRPVPETLDYWIEVNGADRSAATRHLLPDRVPEDGCRIVKTSYPKAPGGKPVVVFYQVKGGGHAVPVPRQRGMRPQVKELIGNPCEDMDGPQAAWDFMCRF
jgi:polyhydroxybutyrate depolymerase